MKNSSYTDPLNQELNPTDLLYMFIEVHRNALELKKMPKNLSWKGTESSKYQKFACSDNTEQNIQ